MTAPHDRPTAIELLVAVRDWIEQDLMPNVEGRLQFHSRVAMNVIDIVAREIELGPEQEKRHADVLQAFSVSSDAELGALIREGKFDSELESLLEKLRPVVEDKVRVANPRYLR